MRQATVEQKHLFLFSVAVPCQDFGYELASVLTTIFPYNEKTGKCLAIYPVSAF